MILNACIWPILATSRESRAQCEELLATQDQSGSSSEASARIADRVICGAMVAGGLLRYNRSAICIAAFMYPNAYAIPACHGALQLISGV